MGEGRIVAIYMRSENLTSHVSDNWKEIHPIESIGASLEDLPGMDTIHINRKSLTELGDDFAILVMGTPRVGKGTTIRNWLAKQVEKNGEAPVTFIDQPSALVPKEHKHLREDNPFLYEHLLAIIAMHTWSTGTNNIDYLLTEPVLSVSEYRSPPELPRRTKPILAKRGGLDTQVFRQVFDSVTEDYENLLAFETNLEMYGSLPRIGAVIMALARPSIAEARDPRLQKPGAEKNIAMKRLDIINDSYIRLHHGFRQGIYASYLTRGSVPVYAAINMESTPEQNLDKFSEVMEQVLKRVNSA